MGATVFFLMESMSVSIHWKTSMNVGSLVTLVAAVHYFYMREFWVQIHSSPMLYRYIDWSITVPLQMIEFYLILSPAMGLDAEIAAHGFLSPGDPVAISFWIISISMVAATVFFLMESMNVSAHWKTSMNVGALVTLVAAVHYFYMREFWVQIHSSPILYRYIDWSITVPLQMIEFYLILSAVQPNISSGITRLLFGTVF